MTVQCCKCKKTRVQGEWKRLGHSTGQSVTHTYCPVCLNETLEEIRLYNEVTCLETAAATAAS